MMRADMPHPPPNAITFNTAMDAAMRGAQPSQAWEILTLARESGFKPDRYTCSTLLREMQRHASIERHVSRSFALLCECGHTCEMKLRTNLFHTVLEAAPSADMRREIL